MTFNNTDWAFTYINTYAHTQFTANEMVSWFSWAKTTSYPKILMYVRFCVHPWTYISKNITSKPKSSPNVGQNANGSRMYTNKAGFTDTHKYENPAQTYTNTSLLTYISAYALTKRITENLTKPFWPTGSGPKWTSGPFFNPGISDDVRIWPTGSGSKRHLAPADP